MFGFLKKKKKKNGACTPEAPCHRQSALAQALSTVDQSIQEKRAAREKLKQAIDATAKLAVFLPMIKMVGK